MNDVTPEAAFTLGLAWIVGITVAGIVAGIIEVVTVWRVGSWLWKAVTG